MADRTESGKWRARWRDDNGIQRSKSFTRKVDADRHEGRMRVAVEQGTYVSPSAGTTTIAAWADEWLAGARNLSAGGQETYRRDLDRYILPALGTHRLARLTPKAVDDFLTAELEKKIAASTVHRHYRTVRRMLQVAVERGKVAKNPCATVTPPRLPDTEMRFLTVEQVEALSAKITDRYRAWVLVAAYGGLRWSETVGLRVSAVDGAKVTVTEQLVRRGTEWKREAPKTRAGRRAVTLPDSVGDVLAAHIEEHANEGLDGLVFPNRAGKPTIHSSFTQAVFKPALVKAKIDEKTRIHDLRHTAVALAILAGAHPKAIQSRMGHASITVTLDAYGHLFPEVDEEVAVNLDALRSKSATPPA